MGRGLSDGSLQLGQHVRIVFPNTSGRLPIEGGITTLNATELMVTASPTALAAAPPAGTAAQLQHWDALRLFQAQTVVKRITRSPQAGIIVERPSTFECIQTRKYFRVPAGLPVRFSVLDTRAPGVRAADQQAQTVDLSAGGIRFISPIPLEVDDLLHLCVAFHGPDKKTVRETFGFETRVLRLSAQGQERKRILHVAGMFVRVREAERDRMIQLLFDLQRKVG